MKILQVFDFFSLPHGGGTVDVIAKLSKALAERGYEVTICTGDYELDRDYLDSVSRVGLELLHSRINRFGIYYMPDLKYKSVDHFDVIHLHCYRSYQNSVLYRNAIRDGVPFVIDAHGSTVDKGAKNLLRKAYDVAWGYDCLKYASKVIAETVVGVKEWKKLGVPDSKITLLHPFIDIHEFENLPKRHRDRSILYLGRIHKDKGLDFLVRSFARFCRTSIGDGYHLVLAGQDNGYRKTLVELIDDEGVSDRVHFAGFVNGVNKLALLVNADMLIQPSRNEAGARPSLEALMCGTPVIVTGNTGAGKEIEAMQGGLTVEYGNIDELVYEMGYLLDNPKIANKMVQQGRDFIKANLSLESQIVKYERLYNEVRRK